MNRRIRAGIGISLMLLSCDVFAELAWEQEEISLHLAAGERSASAVFHFSNAGSEEITIHRVASSCDCTTTRLQKKTYLPGESGELQVDYAADGQSGNAIKYIVLETSEEKRIKRLLLRISLQPPVVITPRELTWRLNDPPDEKQQVITFAEGQETLLDAASSKNPNFEVELIGADSGKSYVVKVRPKSTAVSTSGAIEFTSSRPGFPRAFARVLPEGL